MRGNGADIFSSFETSLSKIFNSSGQFSKVSLMTLDINSSIISIFWLISQYAISGSTIQNSVKCFLVFDFSALKTGPKQYVLPKAIAPAS